MLIFKGRNRVTSGYHLPERPDHHGLDIVGDDSHDILSPVEGVVRSSTIITSHATSTWEWGNYVRVDDKDGNRLFFCHMDSRAVTVGQKVYVGTRLGVMGNTGLSRGAHTHFEVRKSDGKTRLDPAAYLGIPNKKGTYQQDEAPPDGWVFENGNWHYYRAGTLVRNDWIKTDGLWYRVSAAGDMLQGLITVDGKQYYLMEKTSGKIQRGALIITDGNGALKL